MRYFLLLAATSARAEVKLYVFDCGSLTFEDISVFGVSNDETPVRTLFVPCYLVEHPEGHLLFDAGLPIETAGQGEIEPEPGMVMRYSRSLTDQLADLELTPADIELVAFSHMHFDHVGAAKLFSRSRLLIQRAEHQAAFVDKDNLVYQPEFYLGLADSERVLLDGDHDVFGDGRVVLISAPGHTPGHQALLLRLDNFGPLVLSGDLYHFRKSRELRRAPIFNTSPTETFESMEKVESLVAREGATLWIQHDKALADTLHLAPAHYD